MFASQGKTTLSRVACGCASWNVAAGLAVALLTGVFAFSTADAASDRGPEPAAVRTAHATWGAGPIVPTLIEVAQHEAPVGGVAPTSKSDGSSQPVLAVDDCTPETARPIPVAYTSFASR